MTNEINESLLQSDPAVWFVADNIIFGWQNEFSKIAETNEIKNKCLQASGKAYSIFSEQT